MHKPSTSPPAPDLRVFISSTFDDLRAEREQLMKHVFPELRGICRARGGDLTEIDLRWGVTEEQTTAQQIVKACLEQIARHRPWFISIIGERYGWIPARNDVADAELLRQFPWLRAAVDERRSLIELEITEGALRQPLLTDRAFFYFRAPGASVDHRDERAAAEFERLRALKERIRASGLPVREGFTTPEELAGLVRADLLEAIDRTYPPPSHDDPLSAERAAHEAFARTRRRGYVEVAGTVERLDALVDSAGTDRSADGTSVIITGASGVGKSALIAHWTDRMRERNADAFVITHYIGAAAGSGDHLAVLRHIIAEIRDRYDVQDAIPTLAEDIVREFPAWLSRIQRERVIIAIDALNQIDALSQGLAWLPEHVPPRVRFIVSATEGPALEALRDRRWPEIEVQPLTIGERRDLVERYLEEYGKRFDARQLERISQRQTSANALYLRTQLEELRNHGSYEGLNQRIDYYLAADDLDDLFLRVLLRLEEDYGVETVRELMTLVWGSRSGLSEGELADLTGLEPASLETLLAALGYHLMHRNGLLGFYHDHLRRAVETRYLGGTAAHALHERLGAYFSALEPGPRRAAEEPWQWVLAGALDRLRSAITDVPLALAIKRHTADFELARYWVALGDRVDVGAAYGEGMERFETETPDTGTVADALDALAQFLVDLGHYETAERFARRSLALRESLTAEGDIAIASSLDRLATLLYHTGRSAEAIELAERALDIRRASLAEDHPDIARTIADLGALLYGAGRSGDAGPILREALRAARHRDPSVTAMILNNLGAIHLADRAFEEAASYFEQARNINRRLLGLEHPEVASNLVNLAFALSELGSTDAAETYYREALAIVERSLGSEHPQVAVIATNMGTLYRNQERLEAAELMLRRALAIRKATVGPEHTETTACMVRLANVLRRAGRVQEGRVLYEEALEIRSALLPPDHPSVTSIEGHLASIRAEEAERSIE